MKVVFVLVVLFLCNRAFAQPPHELERINFYPRVKSYVKGNYSYQMLHISTPQGVLNEKEIRNYKNVFDLSYAYKLPYFFIGASISYELASETATAYGISSNERYSSQDFTDPMVFMKARLREQNSHKGLIDLYLSFTDSYGKREIGKSSSNRRSGRNSLSAILTSGYKEEEWEFSNNLLYTFYDEGEEHNDFTQKNYDLRSYNIFNYTFQGQYEINPWWYANAGIGFEYRSVQKISDRAGDKREIQAGTGSIFQLGLKKPISKWSVAEFKYELKRNAYFVKGESNFDGDATLSTYLLALTHGF